MNGKAAEAAIYPQKLCVEILKGIRDTAIEEDLEKEMDKESKSQNLINSLAHTCHPWGGCITTGVFAPRGEDKGSGAPNPGTKGSGPKGIIASMNSSRREDVQKFFDEVTHAELPGILSQRPGLKNSTISTPYLCGRLSEHRSAGTRLGIRPSRPSGSTSTRATNKIMTSGVVL